MGKRLVQWAIIRVWGIIPTNYFRLGYNSSMGLNSSRGYNSREYGTLENRVISIFHTDLLNILRVTHVTSFLPKPDLASERSEP